MMLHNRSRNLFAHVNNTHIRYLHTIYVLSALSVISDLWKNVNMPLIIKNSIFLFKKVLIQLYLQAEINTQSIQQRSYLKVFIFVCIIVDYGTIKQSVVC